MTPGDLTITVNGTARAVPAGATAATVAADLGAPETGCAVAVNDQVLPRSRWASRQLDAGDRIEVLVATQGG